MISTLCKILSAHATCNGDPIIGLQRFTFAPFSKRSRTRFGSPRKMARSSGEARSGSGEGGGQSTLAPCLISNVARFVLPVMIDKMDKIRNYVY